MNTSKPKVCPICNATFASSNTRSTHIRFIHKEEKKVLHNYTLPEKIKCHVCNYETNTKGNLQRHIKQLHKEASSQIEIHCKICTFKTKAGDGVLRKHVKNVHIREGKEKYDCSICSKSFDQKGNLKEHMLGVHLANKKFKCSLCDYEGNRKENLKMHMRGVHENLTYNCSKCEFKCKSKEYLKNHINIEHEGVQRKAYSCSECSSTFIKSRSLKTHFMSVHEGVKRSFSCDLCDHKSTQKGHLKNHIKFVHFKVKEYSCLICDKQFSIERNLKRHTQAFHNTEKHSCEQCSFETTSLTNLKKHAFNKHEVKTEQFSCNTCEYKTKIKLNLSKHVRNVHTVNSVKRLECSDCDYVGRNLKLHVINTHGERIHKCEKCDYVAKSKYRLKDHVDKVHTEKEMFACHICDYKTKYKCSLKPHIDNVHLQLNEKCPTCGKEFRRTELNSHIKIKHSTEDKRFHCPKCELTFHRQCDVYSHIAYQEKTHKEGIEF